MKKFLTITLLAVAGLLATPQAVQAGPSLSLTYQSGHAACGCPIYTQRIVTGFDHFHRPVYRYVAVPVAHRCRTTCSPRPILRTSSCGPWVIPTHRSHCAPSPPVCHSVRRTYFHHSAPIVRIRTHGR